MATLRDNPYGAFNFIVSLGGDQGDGSEGTIVGGFSDVSGLGKQVTHAEYRNGNEMFNTARQIPMLYKADEVTLKRGLIGSTDLFDWIEAVSEGTPDPRNVTITLLDEARQAVAVWRLYDAQPKTYKGPGLTAKGTEVATEELGLVCRRITYA